MERSQRLKELLREKILVLDGAMGTAIKAQASRRRFRRRGLRRLQRRPQPHAADVVEGIHAGTSRRAPTSSRPTPSAPPRSSSRSTRPSTKRRTRSPAPEPSIARRAADAFSTPEKPRFVAGAMGPTTKAISVTGGVTFDELVEAFEEQARAPHRRGRRLPPDGDGAGHPQRQGGPDRHRAGSRRLGVRVPVAVSGTIEPMGTMLAGPGRGGVRHEPGARRSPLHRPQLRHRPRVHDRPHPGPGGAGAVPVGCVPNAGLPDEEGRYVETPEMMAASSSASSTKDG